MSADPAARGAPRVIANPLSGEHITISAAADPGGRVLEWQLVLAPGGRVPSSHAQSGWLILGRLWCGCYGRSG